MKKTVRKIFAVLMIACLFTGMLSSTAFAGNNQTEIHIHHVGDVREGNGEVTVIIDGVSYPGYKKGSTLTVDLGTEDNGFSFGADGSKEIQYRSGDNSGTIIVTHQEGNGTSIENEKDKGMNNFNGEIKNTPPANNEPTDDGEPPVSTEPVVPVIPYVPVFYVPEQVEEIPEEEVPLAELPDEDVPLVELPEEDVPLADVPRTGDAFLVWMLLAVVSLAAMPLLLVKTRKEN